MFSKCVREVLFKRQAFNAARSLFYTGYDAKNIVILQSSIQGHFTKAPARSFSVSYCEKNAAAKDLKCAEDSKQRKEAKGYFMNSGVDENMDIKIKNQGNARFVYNWMDRLGDNVVSPMVRNGFDVIVQTRNGCDNKDTYVYPLGLELASVCEPNLKYPRVLVLTPTSELAKEGAVHFRSYMPKLYAVSLHGGASISYQEHQLKMGADIVVGTPGVIIDLIQKGSLNISKLNHVVFDEVDTMINMGFTDDMDMILRNRYCAVKRDENPQTLFFAATVPSWVHDTTKKYLSRDVMMKHKKNKDIDESIDDFKENMKILNEYLHNVRQSNKMKFNKLAKELMKKSDPVNTLATALALVCNLEQTSLINKQLGFVTLKFTSDTKVRDSYHAFKLLPEILANEVRNIRMCKGNESFVFDVPMWLENKYNESRKNEYTDNISVIDCLPSLVLWENSN